MSRRIVVQVTPDVPREVERALRPLLRRAERYWPFWVRTVQIQFITNPKNIEARGAEICTNPNYYAVTLMIHARWLDYAEVERYRCLIHEIGHAHHADAWHRVRTLMEKLNIEASMVHMLDSVIRGDFEKSAEGFAQMVVDLEGKSA